MKCDILLEIILPIKAEHHVTRTIIIMTTSQPVRLRGGSRRRLPVLLYIQALSRANYRRGLFKKRIFGRCRRRHYQHTPRHLAWGVLIIRPFGPCCLQLGTTTFYSIIIRAFQWLSTITHNDGERYGVETDSMFKSTRCFVGTLEVANRNMT